MCFKTRNDYRLEDWREVVISTVDENQDEYIIALFRPYDKVQGKCVDIPLESLETLRLNKIKDHEDLRRKLTAQDGFLV